MGGGLPVALRGAGVPIPYQEDMAGWQLGDALEDTQRIRDVAKPQVCGERGRVHAPPYPGAHDQGLQLGAENQALRRLSVVERLDPQVISCQKERLPPRIPEGEGEHASQVADAIGPVLLVEVHECLGVRGGREAVAARQEIGR